MFLRLEPDLPPILLECLSHTRAERNCIKYEGTFEDYRDEVLERLADESVVEVEGRRQEQPAPAAKKK
jgi:hypothetical protein